MKNKLLIFALLILMCSCVSTKSTLKNVDEHALIPKLNANNTFVITEFSKDPKYGYDKDYPINVFYKNAKDENINQQRYLNALAGPKGEKITYKKIETCCPFPTKNTEMGVGLLDVYEITWEGQREPVRLHLNYLEKSTLMVPVGLTLKK
ncbi:2-dehydro-3-deoxyphosphooctonate aldolase [Flavobacterium sp.]|uniref:2-dehydro-3-deoxyphosphooctonate aldolase n=1 Tax=Flavobacterium sp. TaxID=239 RepID=UPI002609CB70|nr:2-dehydro-3-deoxyphosphooctonate aldolase [Flavobacterium sp.]